MRDELINFLMCHGHTKERSEQVADLVCAELEQSKNAEKEIRVHEGKAQSAQESAESGETQAP